MRRSRRLVLIVLGCAALGAWFAAPGRFDSEPTSPRIPRTATSDVPATAPTRKPDGVLPLFRIVGVESGLNFSRFDDISPLRRILEVNGGGVAVIDSDRDGRLDLFFTNGCRLPPREGDHDTPCRFFRNRGDMRFLDITPDSRLHQFGYNHGCAVGDYDADGFDDLYVTAYGRDALWHGNGDGTFSDVSVEAGIDVPEWGASAAFGDVDGDGWLDLYVTNYLLEDVESPTLCPHSGSPDGHISCPPAKFEGVDDVLFLSDGQGGFLDVTESSGLAGMRGKGLGVVICDFDTDGKPEIYVANDGQANFLLVRERSDVGASQNRTPDVHRADVRFIDRAMTSGVALNEAGFAQAGMGVAAGDCDENGTMDLFLTHFFGDTNTLYVNRGGLDFEDATRRSGVGPPSRKLLGWGTVFVDLDNNGWLDLVAANGHVEDRTWESAAEPYRMRPLVYRNEQNGTMRDVTPWCGEYCIQEWLGRGMAAGDLDRDGLVDLVVSHQLAPSLVLRNETRSQASSVTLRLVGTASVRNGYGARVRIADDRSGVRELSGGGSFHSAGALEIHLGLGAQAAVPIQVIWPSGETDTFSEVTAGTWGIVEGRPQIIRLVAEATR